MTEPCTYPRCKCIVSTSTSQPKPTCPRGLPAKIELDPRAAARECGRLTNAQWSYILDLLETEYECNENPTADEILSVLQRGASWNIRPVKS